MNDDFDSLSKKIGKKIKLERIKRDISQEDLSFEAGLARNTIWKIESGRVSPTVDSLEKIAHALGIDFATLTDVTKVDL